MAELKNEDEEVQRQQQRDAHGILPKRKTELSLVDEQDIADNGKKQKSENSSADKNCSETKIGEEEDDDDDDDEEEEEDYEREEDEDEDEDDEDEDFDEEHSNGEVAIEVDRKGKGILREDNKGKGKLIQESDDDDSSDDDDDSHGGGGGVESDGNSSSDLSEDPLAEVDLDNILPSRTRRRGTSFHPGLCLSKDPRKNGDA